MGSSKSSIAPPVAGIEVAELPREEIDIAPPDPPFAPNVGNSAADDSELRDHRLGPIMLVIVAIITAAAVLWALLA